MSTWLLVILGTSSMMATEISVPNLPNKEACDALGKEMLARYKQANSNSRTYACFEIKGSPTTPQ